jgi:lipopolysaccharide assembly outer membrane protein LptD (OstA)
MAIKIEWVLIFFITITLLVSFSLRVEDSIHKTGIQKELNFKDTIFAEVDTSGLLSFANVKNGEQTNGILTMHDISFDKIDDTKVTANRAVYEKDEIVLSGNVKIKQKNGFVFNSQKAIYNTRSGKITSKDKYNATLNGNLLTGDNLSYDTKKLNATSSGIHAILHTQDK